MMITNATTTTRTSHNGQLAAVRRAVLRSLNPDPAKKIFYTREIGPGPMINGAPSGKLVETWSELKQDLNRGDYLRRDLNGNTIAKQSLDTATRTTTITDARGLATFWHLLFLESTLIGVEQHPS